MALPTGGHDQRIRVSRGGAGRPRGEGLYGTTHSASSRGGGPPGGRLHPLATVMRSQRGTLKHHDPMPHVVVIRRVCDQHWMMTWSSNADQVSAGTSWGQGELSRSARNVATSVEGGRTATRENILPKPSKSLTSL